MVHTQTTLAPAARGKGAVAAQGRAPLDDYAPGRSPRLRGLPAAPSPSARWLPGRGYHGWLSRLTPYRRQHSLKSLNETVPYPYSRGDSVMSQRATQSSTKAVPKQHQSSTKAVPKQYQSSTKAVPNRDHLRIRKLKHVKEFDSQQRRGFAHAPSRQRLTVRLFPFSEATLEYCI